jgi:methylenetetrahydrofolate reductase (NADPH)
MSKLRETLDAGAFAVVVEIKLPKGLDVDYMLAPVKALTGRVTAFSVPDNEHAKMRLSSVAASYLVQQAGGEALVHFSCRDRNRLGLESDLLGAAALGLENLLVVSGDYVTKGDHPQAKPVYDADSVQLLQIVQGLVTGHDSAGLPLQGNPTFFPGAVVIPEADPLALQLVKFQKKLTAGAQFFIAPAIFDLEKLRRFREHLPGNSVKLLVSLKVLGPDDVALAAAGQLRKVYSVPPNLVQDLVGKEPEEIMAKGVEVAANLAKQIKQEKLADGLYLKATGRADLLTKIMEAGGL